jgi:polysaccharide export outer membrane protein
MTDGQQIPRRTLQRWAPRDDRRAVDPSSRARTTDFLGMTRARMAGVRISCAIIAVWALGAVGLAEEYEVGPGDVLRIEVAGRPEMTNTFEVDTTGMINYWEVGRVKASGYTTASLAHKLTTLLVEGRFMRRPQVRVTVAEYGSQKVYVAGEVQRQGYYALKADRALRGVMSDIPLTPNAGHEVIVIRPSDRRPLLEEPVPDAAPPAEETAAESPDEADSGSEEAAESSQEGEEESEEPAQPQPILIPGLPPIDPSNEVVRVNLLQLQVGGPGLDVTLRSGDTIFVPRAAQVYVTGAVARPGSFRYEPGMTVLQALTLAGGVSARGSEGRTKVIRIEDGVKTEQKVKPTDLLEPEDRLEVPERFF